MKHHPLVAICLFLVIQAGVAGCSEGRKPGLISPVSASTGKVTTEESQAFSEQFEKQFLISQKDSVEWGAFFNWGNMVGKSCEDFNLEASQIEQVKKGFVTGVSSENGLLGQLKKNSQANGSYSLLRVVDRDGVAVPIFRLLLANDGGINYHELKLGKDADGEVRIQDIYVHLTGENLSASIKRGLYPFIAKSKQNIISQLLQKDQAYIKAIPQLEKLQQLQVKKDYQGILDLYKKLPVEMRRDKNILTVRLMSAQKNSEIEYIKAMDDFRIHHPKDTCIDFITLDADLMKKKYDHALKSLDNIKQSVEGDPHLDVMVCSILLMAGREKESIDSIEKSIAKYPNEKDLYFSRMGIAIDQKNHGDLLKWLKIIDEKFKHTWIEMKTLPEFADFVKSPQHKQWLEHLAAKKKN